MDDQLVTSPVGDLIAFTILFYDHLLTLPAEVRHFWRGRTFSVFLVFFFFTRYFALLLHIFSLTRVTWPTDGKTTDRAGVMLVQLSCAAIMAMRVYALYEKSRRILTCLCITVAGVLGFSLWALFYIPTRTGGFAYICYMNPSLALHTAIAWAGQLAFDAVVFVLTLWKACCIGSTGNRSLVNILVRDGALYFACVGADIVVSEYLTVADSVISSVNAANIATLLLASVRYKPVMGTVSNSLNVIMVSRLVLNLQEPARRYSVEHTTGEENALMMTSVVPCDDVPFSMCRRDDGEVGIVEAWQR